MIKKSNFKFIMIFLIGIFLIAGICAESVSYCCEKTTDGAWCQNVAEEYCDDNYRKLATSCESTNFCKQGCCYDSQEGTCTENSPQSVCEAEGGYWTAQRDCDIEQCAIGCCLMGDQAAFVTQTRCKRLATIYGLETTFRSDISNELTCIASATSSVVKGACVFDTDEGNDCEFTTEKKCSDLGGKFHKDFLCTAESLGTICSPTTKTTCVEGKDEIYFLDSCGNVANIYDSSKINNKEYWKKIYTKEESCGYGSANVDSGTCGNCDYSKGSTCEEKLSGKHVCQSLDCKYNGKTYKHGESWCADSPGLIDFLPGSRAFRLVCFNGEVTSEPCADFRAQLCFEYEDPNGAKVAGCGANLWTTCVHQTTKKDCENSDLRDCQWIEGINIDAKGGDDKEDGSCVPLFAPGLEFWGKEKTKTSGSSFSANYMSRTTGSSTRNAETTCSYIDQKCVVKWEVDILGNKKCIDGCECVGDDWEEKMIEACKAMGDCAGKVNYLGIKGYSEDPEVEKEDAD